MMKVLFSGLTIIIFLVKFGEPNPKMMSIHGDIDFFIHDQSFTDRETVGYLFDDEDGDFAINPSFCSNDRKGYECFMTTESCNVKAQCRQDHEVTKQTGYFRRHEPDFPSESTGSNMLLAEYDAGSPYTTTVSHDGEAVTFADVTRRIASLDIQCNKKDADYYSRTFRPGTPSGQIRFDQTAFLLEYTMKCVVEILETDFRTTTGRAFVLTITGLDNRAYVFPALSLSNDISYIRSSPQNAITKIDPSFESNFVFRATSTNDEIINISIENKSTERLTSNVLSFTYGILKYRMPAIYADSPISCGIQHADSTTFNYWCELN